MSTHPSLQSNVRYFFEYSKPHLQNQKSKRRKLFWPVLRFMAIWALIALALRGGMAFLGR